MVYDEQQSENNNNMHTCTENEMQRAKAWITGHFTRIFARHAAVNVKLFVNSLILVDFRVSCLRPRLITLKLKPKFLSS